MRNMFQLKYKEISSGEIKRTNQSYHVKHTVPVGIYNSDFNFTFFNA